MVATGAVLAEGASSILDPTLGNDVGDAIGEGVLPLGTGGVAIAALVAAGTGLTLP